MMHQSGTAHDLAPGFTTGEQALLKAWDCSNAATPPDDGFVHRLIAAHAAAERVPLHELEADDQEICAQIAAAAEAEAALELEYEREFRKIAEQHEAHLRRLALRLSGHPESAVGSAVAVGRWSRSVAVGRWSRSVAVGRLVAAGSDGPDWPGGRGWPGGRVGPEPWSVSRVGPSAAGDPRSAGRVPAVSVGRGSRWAGRIAAGQIGRRRATRPSG